MPRSLCSRDVLRQNLFAGFGVAAALAGGILCASAAFGQSKAAVQQKPAAPAGPRQLSLENEPWKGDFDGMLERRIIRVLMPYSRTLFFVDKGHERGLSAELMRDFEQYLNKKHAKQLRRRPMTVVLIPTTRDKLFTGVADGLGDIAVGNLTATDERRRIVDFIAPTDTRPVREVIVTGPTSAPLGSLDELAGKRIHVRKATSYHDSVLALNARLKAAGKPPAAVVELPAAVEDEDVLEMLNAGLLHFTVVDDWKARMWAQVLPKVKVREDLVLRADGYIGWAMRKGSPKLAAEAEDFYKRVVKRSGGAEERMARYHKRIKQISNNTAGAEWKRFQAMVMLFEKYGARYGFDPLMLAAQGFQESKLRQDARSHAGAIGVMQIMPATGKELKVGDITVLEPNIHAGAKYMDQLMKRFGAEADFSEEERPLFAFASYNAGQGNIARMRRIAAERGLDDNQWFNNVELVVADKIGIETTTYVRNIYKYYVAYKLALEAQDAARKAREQVAPRPGA